MSDDEPTLDDIPMRQAYAGGPPTIEEQLSPFHNSSQPGSTIQGMPAAQLSPPVITSLQPGDPPIPAPLLPPQIINAPAQLPTSGGGFPPDGMPPDGPTVPDGFPALLSVATPYDASDLGLDEIPTNPYASRRQVGSVPSPEAPNIEISKSMEYDVSHLDDPDPKQAPRVAAARHAVAQPTEVMLPALGRGSQPTKKRKDRSDAWLVLGLLFLVMVILGLLAAVILGVLQRVS